MLIHPAIAIKGKASSHVENEIPYKDPRGLFPLYLGIRAHYWIKYTIYLYMENRIFHISNFKIQKHSEFYYSANTMAFANIFQKYIWCD